MIRIEEEKHTRFVDDFARVRLKNVNFFSRESDFFLRRNIRKTRFSAILSLEKKGS